MPTVGGSYFLVTWNFPCFLKSMMKYNKYDLNQQGYFFLFFFFFSPSIIGSLDFVYIIESTSYVSVHSNIEVGS